MRSPAPVSAAPPCLPEPRGPLSERVVAALHDRPGSLDGSIPAVEVADPLGDDDLHLALYTCYELHYRSFGDVDERWEWDPALLTLRSRLEAPFEAALRSRCGGPPPSTDVATGLHDLIDGFGGRSLSSHVADHGSLDQLRELAVHRSAYQLKEADPHTWAIPRLSGRPKAAMVEIQADEYGQGVESAMHATLFEATMAALGLDPRYGAYLDLIPGPTLATVNLVSMFGLHRRLRGALVGHLALFEMTSVVPMARYAVAVERLGFGAGARRFYDAHVAADAHHQVVAATSLAGGLVAQEPALAADVLFGARAVMAVEDRFATRVLEAWDAGETSLRAALPVAEG